jgi:hypothetical protein
MESFERKNAFIKDNITRHVHSTGGDFKTLNPFVTKAIA